MSLAELKKAVDSLSLPDRAELQEYLQALEEDVSVEELRAMNAALDEALNDPSPGFTLEEVRESIRTMKPDDAP
jgi:hypothetical protein